MRSLSHDVRSAVRALVARPGYAAVCLVTLALGIGTTTAIFSVVDALLLRPLPYGDVDRVVQFEARRHGQPANGYFTFAGLDTVRRLDAFAGVEGYRVSNRVMTGGSEPQLVSLLETTPGLLRLLAAAPQWGRVFDDTDARGASGPVVVLSDGLWREQFGADRDVLGRSVLLNDVPHLVIGVMPRGFAFPRPGLRGWTLFSDPPAATVRLELVARLRSEVSYTQAEQLVATINPVLQEQKAFTAGRTTVLAPLTNITQSERTPVLMLLGAVSLVLVIACANVTGLALASGSARQRDLALRLAVGASRFRLARQILFESALLAVAAAAAGAGLAYAGVSLVLPLLPTDLSFFNANEIRVDGRVLLFAISMAVATVFLTGLLPALRGSRQPLGEVLKQGGRTSTLSRAEGRTLSLLALAQCAFAVLLLASAALMARSYLRLQHVDLGFNPERLAVLTVDVPLFRFATAESQAVLRQALADQLRNTPGVLDVSIAGGMPPEGGAFWFGVAPEIDSAVPSQPGDEIEIAYNPVDTAYFTTMGIPIVAGRDFTTTDSETDVVVNDRFATAYWGSAAAAVGGRFRLTPKEPWNTVVGVAGDVRQMGVDDRFGPFEYYHPWSRTHGWTNLKAALRVSDDPAALLPALRERVWSVDGSLPVRESVAMRTFIAETLDRPRFFFLLLITFAGIAVAVAAMGVYALFSYTVSRRRHEFGIRLALGATPRAISRRLLAQGGALAAAGIVIGLLAAQATSRLLGSLLFETAPHDSGALAGAAASLLVVAVLACYVPARRARRVDPVHLLRAE